MSPKLLLIVAVLAVLVAVFVVSSGWGRPYQLEPYPYPTADDKETFADYTLPARVSAAGQPLGTLAMGQRLTFSSDGLPRTGGDLPVPETEMQTPCGWQRIETHIRLKQGFMAALFRVGHDLTISPRVQRPLHLAYDNRGGGATTLKVGELQFPVAADATGILHVAADGCSGEAEVRAGDTSLGKIAMDLGPQRATLDSHLLVLAGQHCYVSQTVAYGRGFSSDEDHLHGARLYDISDDEFEFPKEPPASIEGTEVEIDGHRYGGSDQRHYIWDEPCN